ncbi:MAG TPA: hypothetical protein VHU87_10265 [Rhizomicrobium sp.]|jgi:hypothetical protein|nr:hypothetical protein [Rhizomicrobium sp.]
MARRPTQEEREIEEEFEEALHPIEALIEQRPLEAVIASVLIGVLIGRFFL